MKPTLTDGTEERWSVFVGGAEVAEYLMDFTQASDLAQLYIEDEYDDVVVLQYDTGEEVRF